MIDQIAISVYTKYSHPIWIVRAVSGHVVKKTYHHPMTLSIEEVIDATCKQFGLSPDDFLTDKRANSSVFNR